MADDIFTSIPKLNYVEKAIDLKSEEFSRLVHSRRSIRVYDKTPIPEAIVNDCLDLALLAPNSSNLQPWEFHWVRSKEKKAQVVEACFSQPAARTAAEIIIAVGRTKTWKKHAKQMLELFDQQENPPPNAVQEYYKKIVPFAYTLGPFGILGYLKKLVVFVIGFFRPVPREPTTQSELKTWAVKSTALACENLMLALRAHGFDSCPMEGLDSRRISKILKLPSDAVVVMGISAGKRADNGVYGQRLRFPRNQFVKEV